MSLLFPSLGMLASTVASKSIDIKNVTFDLISCAVVALEFYI